MANKYHITGLRTVPLIKDNKRRTFREHVEEILMSGEDRLRESLMKLPPAKYVDAYIKLLPYGLAKAPELKPLSSDEIRAIEIKKETQTISVLTGAEIPAEDQGYAEEEEDDNE